MKNPILVKVSPDVWETPDRQFRVEKGAGRYAIYAECPDGSTVAYGTLITRDDEHASIRTCNAVQKFINSEANRLDMNDRYGVGTPESQKMQRDALEMTQATLDNQIKKIRDFEAELKVI